nr:hypothetical protein [Tanacetum cinerariifolium]
MTITSIFCHQCTCELCGNGAHYGYNCPPKVSIVPDPEPFNNQTIKELPPTVPSFDPTCYSKDGNSFTCDSTSNLVHDSPNIFDPPPPPPFYPCEFCGNDARYGHYCTPQVPFIYPKPCYNQDINFPQDFHDFQQQYLCCENYRVTHKASNSSVENLVPNPSESEGEYECDVPACEVFTTFSNILFDSDYDFYSSDDQSFSNEDIPKKLYSNPLFDEEIISKKIDPHHFNAESGLIESMLNHDSSIIPSSSKIDSLFDELLYDNLSPHPPEEFIFENFDTAFESFSPFPIPIEDSDSFMKEINLSFTPDDLMPPGIEEDDYDSEKDILILEELLGNDSLSLPENESFHFDTLLSSRPPAKPP